VAYGGGVTVTVPFQGLAADRTGLGLRYCTVGGLLLHANAVRLAATGVNTAVGFDNPTGSDTTHAHSFSGKLPLAMVRLPSSCQEQR